MPWEGRGWFWLGADAFVVPWFQMLRAAPHPPAPHPHLPGSAAVALKVAKELLALGAAPSTLWLELLLSFGEFYQNL